MNERTNERTNFINVSETYLADGESSTNRVHQTKIKIAM